MFTFMVKDKMTKQTTKEEEYSSLLKSALSKFSPFNLKNYLYQFYQKIPSSIERYLEPEKDYLDNLADEINPYLNSIRQNLINSISKNPKIAMKTSLEGLLFPSQDFKEDLCSKIKESVEEISYTAEIAAVEGYKIWEVKSNLPIIEKIAKSKIKKYFSEEDLPTFDYTKKQIINFKGKIYGFLNYIGFNSDKKIKKSEIRNKYQRRMKKLGYDNRRLLEYDYYNRLHIPLNAKESEEFFKKKIKEEYREEFKSGRLSDEETFSTYYQDKKRERQKKFINSEYNSFWEKIICSVGYFFSRLFS